MTHRSAPLLLWLVPLFAALWGCSRNPNSRFDERFDVGPGQQALIAAMVGQGAALPESCALVDTVVERTHFQAHYACPGTGAGAPGTIEFRHREVAPRGSVVTAQFTMIPFGGHVIPPALLADVTARVRAHESAWRWVPLGQGGAPVTLRGPPPAAPADVPTPRDAAPPPAPPPSPPPSAAPTAPPLPSPAPDSGTQADVTVAPAVAAPPSPPSPPSRPAEPDPPPPPAVTPAVSTGPQIAAPSQGFGEAGPTPQGLGAFATDGVLIYLAGLAFVLLVVRRQLSDAPAGAAPALAGVVLGGAALRLALAPATPLNAWSYARVIPLAAHSYDGPVLSLVGRATGATLPLTAVIFSAGFALAAATPLVLFAHARYVLKDWRSALAAAAILALLPLHIRFSRSDVEILQALLTSSFTFVVLYAALTDASPRWRAACFALLPLLCVATYYSRPEAIVFFPLDLGGVLIASGASSRRRRALAAALITAAAVFSVVTHLLVHYRQNVDDGLSLRTLETALRTLFSLRFNMILSPWSSPPGLVLLAVFGGAWLWRSGERARCAFLVLWFLAFFVVHSYVPPTVPAMTARYHLNLVTPFVLLAAAAAPALLRAPPWARVGAALYLCASPFLHRGFIRDVDYFEMREFAFLESIRGRIPDRCTVLEFQPALADTTPDRVHASRLARVGSELRAGRRNWRWSVVPLSVLTPAAPGREAREVLSPAARALVARPPACLRVYLGLTCLSHGPGAPRPAPVCDEVRAALDLEPVVETRFRSHIYDAVSVGRLLFAPDGTTRTVVSLHDGGEARLGLYRPRAR